MDNILYYPYINLPPTGWTLRSLLYYETIGSIVPYSYLNNERSYDPFMRTLVREKLVTPLNPLTAIEHPNRLTGTFVEYLSSKEVDLEKRRRNFKRGQTGRIHKGKFTHSLGSIHTEKFDYGLFHFLEINGIGARSRD